MTVERHEFASDNVAPICPEAWAALQEANLQYAPSYGEDRWTARVCDRIREIFETDCDVYFVFTGTAANALARAHQLSLHMDGARFANAIASLNCAPKAITWKVGVDVLCFGGTKNGATAGELVIFFDKKISREFDYRVKQAGHLGSKMRFLAAQWLGLLNRDAWLRNAQHANRAARGLATRLRMQAGIESVFPIDANAVFVAMDERLASGLHARGWRFYKFIEPDVYRLMCSWSTTGEQISGLLADIVAIK